MSTPSMTLTACSNVHPASCVTAQGSFSTATLVAAALPLVSAGPVTFTWTLDGGLLAGSTILTWFGGIGGASSATVTVTEPTKFILLSFMPGNPGQTMVAQVNVTPPAAATNLVPPSVIGAWASTAPIASSFNWETLASNSSLGGRFLMGTTTASKAGPGGGSHLHTITPSVASGQLLSAGAHPHGFTGLSGRMSSTHGGGVDGGHVDALVSPGGFTTNGNHSHTIQSLTVQGLNSAGTPTTAASTSSATGPLPPFFVVRFRQKLKATVKS